MLLLWRLRWVQFEPTQILLYLGCLPCRQFAPGQTVIYPRSYQCCTFQKLPNFPIQFYSKRVRGIFEIFESRPWVQKGSENPSDIVAFKVSIDRKIPTRKSILSIFVLTVRGEAKQWLSIPGGVLNFVNAFFFSESSEILRVPRQRRAQAQSCRVIRRRTLAWS